MFKVPPKLMLTALISWKRRHHVVIMVLTLLIGVLSGYIAVGFRLGIESISAIWYGPSSEATFLSYVATLPWYHRFLGPIAGGALVCIMLRYLSPDHRAHGIPDVIESTFLKGGRFETRAVWSSALISLTTLGVGGSAGREGPVVHACAGGASLLSDALKISAENRLTLVGCAVAAGIAASFNTPLAGVIFALEVVVGSYALRSFAPVVVASVLGTMVTRTHIGNYPAFQLPSYGEMNLLELPAFALLGIVCAVAATLFMKSITLADDVSQKTKVPVYLRPLAGGILLGAVAVVFPEVLGVGYEATSNALLERYDLITLLVLIGAKSTATAVTLGTRFGGGIFSGSLYIGAMTGGAFGIVAASLFPDYGTSHGFYALVGMAAVTGAVLGAPISTVFMIFELTHNTNATIAIMLATAISSMFVTLLQGNSFFLLLLTRRGISISGGRVRQLLNKSTVAQVMFQDVLILDSQCPLGQAYSAILHHINDDALIVDSDGRLIGRLNYSDFRDVDFSAGDGDGVTVAMIARKAKPVLVQRDSLESALEIHDASGEEMLPVVANKETMVPVGIVSHKKILIAYNKALLETRAFEQGDGR